MCFTEEEFEKQITEKIRPILSQFFHIFIEVGYEKNEIEEIMNELSTRTKDAVDTVLLQQQDRKKRLLSDIKSLTAEVNHILKRLKQPLTINVCLLLKLHVD